MKNANETRLLYALSKYEDIGLVRKIDDKLFEVTCRGVEQASLLVLLTIFYSTTKLDLPTSADGVAEVWRKTAVRFKSLEPYICGVPMRVSKNKKWIYYDLKNKMPLATLDKYLHSSRGQYIIKYTNDIDNTLKKYSI